MIEKMLIFPFVHLLILFLLTGRANPIKWPLKGSYSFILSVFDGSRRCSFSHLSIYWFYFSSLGELVLSSDPHLYLPQCGSPSSLTGPVRAFPTHCSDSRSNLCVFLDCLPLIHQPVFKVTFFFLKASWSLRCLVFSAISPGQAHISTSGARGTVTVTVTVTFQPTLYFLL